MNIEYNLSPGFPLQAFIDVWAMNKEFKLFYFYFMFVNYNENFKILTCVYVKLVENML